MTIRDIVKGIQLEVGKGDLPPERARVLLNQLTALLGNVNAEMRAADMEFNGVLLECMTGTEAANRARIRAETTPQYARKREARDVKELTVEMIRSLKIFVRSIEEEMRLSR